VACDSYQANGRLHAIEHREARFWQSRHSVELFGQ
jgi:hypothetical protein